LSVFSNFESFYPIDKNTAKDRLNLKKTNKYILFSDISSSNVKRLDLAKSIEVELKKHDPNYSLLVMSGVDPNMVLYYINSSDFLLLTSDNEGSPSIVKECLLCNTPVYSYDVGDINQFISSESGMVINRKLPIEKQAEKIHTHHANAQYKFNNILSKSKLIKKYEDLYEI
jgi:glycosyltransferase involved in cell wall biosynthesis